MTNDGGSSGFFREVLPEEQERDRVDKVLAQLMPGVTRETIKRWIAEDRVWIDGKACRPSDKVAAGSLIEVQPGPPPASEAEPDPSVPVHALFEDEHLIVVMKPAGVVVHPGKGNWSKTLVNGLLARPGFEREAMDPRDPDGHLRPGIVHRLDKDTSGILVVAKTASAREGLKEQLQSHSMARRYQAITVGTPKEGVIKTLHGRDPGARLRFSSLVRDGKEAVTHVRVLHSLADGQAAHVECRLETGRTHQIRVHLSQQTRTPIVGDVLYGGLKGNPAIADIGRRLGRQALHAAVLGFVHPISRAEMTFEEPLPDDMATALQELAQLVLPRG